MSRLHSPFTHLSKEKEMNRHLLPIWSGSFAVLALILVLPAYGQNAS